MVLKASEFGPEGAGGETGGVLEEGARAGTKNPDRDRFVVAAVQDYRGVVLGKVVQPELEESDPEMIEGSPCD